MNIPLNVQADALQVMVPASTTDYLAIGISAVATLLGVVLGYAFSERQRRYIELDRRCSTVSSDFCYAISVVSVQNHHVIKWLDIYNKSFIKFLNHNDLFSVPEIVIHDVTYERFSQIIPYVPSSSFEYSSIIHSVESVNAALRRFVATYSKKKVKDVIEADVLNEFYENYRAVIQCSTKLSKLEYDLVKNNQRVMAKLLKGSAKTFWAKKKNVYPQLVITVTDSFEKIAFTAKGHLDLLAFKLRKAP